MIFGVPHDVHPTTLTYRDDLFRQAGIDLSQAKTWSLGFMVICIGMLCVTRHPIARDGRA